MYSNLPQLTTQTPKTMSLSKTMYKQFYKMCLETDKGSSTIMTQMQSSNNQLMVRVMLSMYMTRQLKSIPPLSTKNGELQKVKADAYTTEQLQAAGYGPNNPNAGNPGGVATGAAGAATTGNNQGGDQPCDNSVIVL